MNRIETVVLSSLIHNETYLRRVLPFLKKEYFESSVDAKLFTQIEAFSERYGKPPTVAAIKIAANNDKSLSEEEHAEIHNTLDELTDEPNDIEWLLTETEKFCKDRAIYNAILASIQIIDGKDKKKSPDGIPMMLEEALSIGFDNHIGHDYAEDADLRFDYYHNKESRLPCDLDMLNTITSGGVPAKTLNVIMAGVNVGKTLMMCHLASSYLAQGKNVLYITLEMAETEIAKRIDANLLNIPMDDLMVIDRASFKERIEKVRKRTDGRLVIKEYPTGGGHVGHFSALLTELKLKKGFVPDVVFIDYLNICASVRLKADAAAHTYTWVKAIAEEIRGFAVKHKIPVWSATQATRSGSVDNDPDMTDTAESFGLPATVDFFVAVVQDENLEEMGQFLIKQLKNRYRDKSKDRRFVVGVEKAKMRLYDVEKSAQKNLSQDGDNNTKTITRRAKPDTSQIKVT